MSKMLVFWLVGLMAAGTAGIPEPPQPPYVSNAPINAEWTVFVQDRSGAGTTQRYLKEVHVTKAGKDRREIQVWSDGIKTEHWVYRGMTLHEEPESSDVYIFAPGDLETDILDFSQGDFPEMQWLSSDAYVGVVSFENHSCYQYSTKGAHPAPGAPGKQAWIDGQTKLPVALDDGFTLKLYVFKAAPSGGLHLPPRFEKALQTYRNAAEEPRKYKMPY